MKLMIKGRIHWIEIKIREEKKEILDNFTNN